MAAPHWPSPRRRDRVKSAATTARRPFRATHTGSHKSARRRTCHNTGRHGETRRNRAAGSTSARNVEHKKTAPRAKGAERHARTAGDENLACVSAAFTTAGRVRLGRSRFSWRAIETSIRASFKKGARRGDETAMHLVRPLCVADKDVCRCDALKHKRSLSFSRAPLVLI